MARAFAVGQALVDKSHGEYWLQVSAQRLLKVTCAEARHIPDMAKLEECIQKARYKAQHCYAIRLNKHLILHGRIRMPHEGAFELPRTHELNMRCAFPRNFAVHV